MYPMQANFMNLPGNEDMLQLLLRINIPSILVQCSLAFSGNSLKFLHEKVFSCAFLVRNITLISVGYCRVILILNAILAYIIFTLLVWNLGQANTISTLIDVFVMKMRTIRFWFVSMKCKRGGYTFFSNSSHVGYQKKGLNYYFWKGLQVLTSTAKAGNEAENGYLTSGPFSATRKNLKIFMVLPTEKNRIEGFSLNFLSECTDGYSGSHPEQQ